MTDENPYQSPASLDTDDPDPREQARAAVRIPAMCLVVLGSLTLLLDVVIACNSRPGDFVALMGWIILAHIVTFVGAIEMLRLRSYAVARTAMVLACIPVLSPLAFIGIPFGIWGAVVLWKPHITAEFEKLELDKPMFK